MTAGDRGIDRHAGPLLGEGGRVEVTVFDDRRLREPMAAVRPAVA